MQNSKIIKLLSKVVISVALFWILLSKIHINDLIIVIRSMDYRYVVLILLLIVINYVVSSIRWRRLLVFPQSEHVSLGYLITLYFTGSFFNNFMPTSIGGDVYKVVKLGGKIGSKTNAFTATFAERFLGVLALAIIGLVGALKLFGIYTLLSVLVIIITVLIGKKTFLLIAHKIPAFQKIRDSLLVYDSHRDALTFAFFFSFVVQMLSIFSQYFIFKSLGYTPGLLYSFTVLPLITLAGFFIPSLNGIGVQDALYVSLFGAVGIPAGIALSASIAYHILRLVVSLIGGLLYAVGLDE